MRRSWARTREDCGVAVHFTPITKSCKHYGDRQLAWSSRNRIRLAGHIRMRALSKVFDLAQGQMLVLDRAARQRVLNSVVEKNLLPVAGKELD